ncbi:6860_t:CDS:2, partial [Dentiscutata erythropus]
FYDDGDIVLNRMGKTLVPWQSHKIVRNRPSKGRSYTYCGALGHNRRKCPWANNQAGEARIDEGHKRALIQGLNKFKNSPKYKLKHKIIPEFMIRN